MSVTKLSKDDVNRIFSLAAAYMARDPQMTLERAFGKADDGYRAFKAELEGQEGFFRELNGVFDDSGNRYTLNDDGTMTIEYVPATSSQD